MKNSRERPAGARGENTGALRDRNRTATQPPTATADRNRHATADRNRHATADRNRHATADRNRTAEALVRFAYSPFIHQVRTVIPQRPQHDSSESGSFRRKLWSVELRRVVAVHGVSRSKLGRI